MTCTVLTASQITVNEDRKCLCPTRKTLQALMTPFLYKDMVINTRQLSELLAATLSPSRPGLPHVRTI
jgi:hypothetical protein